MIRKHKTRELAMQILFVWDAHASDDTEMARQAAEGAHVDPEMGQDALAMARGAWEQRAVADQWVQRLAPLWPTGRQPAVDRNVLRLAIWELTATHTPPKVVLDEAIELAKQFSTEQSPAFVNGVLDAILKEREALTAGGPAPAAETKSESSETPPSPAAPPARSEAPGESALD